MYSSLLLALVVSSACLSAVACSKNEAPIRRTDENMPPNGSAGAGGGATYVNGGDGGTGGAAGEAPSKPEVDCDKERPGSKMVRVERKKEGDAYCIDTHEATQADYVAFRKDVADAPSKYDSDSFCQKSNPHGYAPFLGPMGDQIPPCSDTGLWYDHPNRPATCLDWCDASAYCAWAGKRLCGMRDGAAAPAFDPETTTTSVTSSEWGVACTEGSPEGAAAQARPDGCFPAEKEHSTDPEDVDARSACVGKTPPYDQIVDLQGNAREWTAECKPDPNGGAVPVCNQRGAPSQWIVERESGLCSVGGFSGLGDASPQVGFRCCSD